MYFSFHYSDKKSAILFLPFFSFLKCLFIWQDFLFITGFEQFEYDMPWGQFSSCAWNSFHFLDSWVNTFHQIWKFWLLSLQIIFLFSLTPTSLQWFQLLINYSPWSPTVQWCSCIFEYLFFFLCVSFGYFLVLCIQIH